MKKIISLLCVATVSTFLFLSCKKETALKDAEPKDFQATNMKMNYYGKTLEYTVKYSPSTKKLVVEGKDAKQVQEIISSHPNALASVKSETEFTFYNHKNEFYNEEEKHFQDKSRIKNNRLMAVGDLADVKFYKDANYVNLIRTSIINTSTKYNFAQYQPCNAAGNWCTTGSFLNRSGVQNPYVGNSENDAYSSLSIVNRYNILGVLQPITVRIILHEDSNYGGGAIQFELTNTNTGIPQLSAYKNNIFLKTWNDRASSYQCYVYNPNI
ncbi:MAG TPA: hypothetical protein PKI86_00650 [Chitinophagales bacterium]|jgi:hypothetical protein|nr:hypothetical protein [Chitinophagales bacterium]